MGLKRRHNMNKRQAKKNHRKQIEHCWMLEVSQELRIFPASVIGIKQSGVERIKKYFQQPIDTIN